MRTDDECYTGAGPANEVATSVHSHSVGEASAKGPAELWLQLHGDCTPDELTEPVDYTGGDVTWCWHQIHDSDVRYVRADLAQANAPSPTYAELLAQRDELAKALRGMLNIVNDSRGVAGYHLNGAVADWGEFEEVDAASAALSRIKGA